MIADAKSNAPINDFRAVLSEQSTWGERGENGALPATHAHHQTLGGGLLGVRVALWRGDLRRAAVSPGPSPTSILVPELDAWLPVATRREGRASLFYGWLYPESSSACTEFAIPLLRKRWLRPDLVRAASKR